MPDACDDANVVQAYFRTMNGERGSLYAWLLIALVVIAAGLFIWRNSKRG